MNPLEACGAEAESGGHVLWGLAAACEVWNHTVIHFDTRGSSFPEFADFLWYLMNVRHFVDEILELVVMVA